MQRFKNKGIRIGIIRGGNHENFSSSIKKGGEFISYIFENFYPKYKPVDIFVDKQNLWHVGGILTSPDELIHKVDLIWDFSTPNISQIIKNFHIPIISNGGFSYLMKNNKNLLRDHMNMLNIKVPNSILFGVYIEDIDGEINNFAITKAREVYQKFSPPYIVKAFNKDESEAVHIVKTPNDLIDVLKNLFNKGDSILIEELIGGQNVKVHLLKNYRGEDFYHFPLIDKISKEEKEKLIKNIKDIFYHLDAKHYLKLDFNIHKNLGIYLNNIEYMPDLISDSHLSSSINSSGSKERHIFEHIIKENI